MEAPAALLVVAKHDPGTLNQAMRYFLNLCGVPDWCRLTNRSQSRTSRARPAMRGERIGGRTCDVVDSVGASEERQNLTEGRKV